MDHGCYPLSISSSLHALVGCGQAISPPSFCFLLLIHFPTQPFRNGSLSFGRSLSKCADSNSIASEPDYMPLSGERQFFRLLSRSSHRYRPSSGPSGLRCSSRQARRDPMFPSTLVTPSELNQALSMQQDDPGKPRIITLSSLHRSPYGAT